MALIVEYWNAGKLKSASMAQLEVSDQFIANNGRLAESENHLIKGEENDDQPQRSRQAGNTDSAG